MPRPCPPLWGARPARRSRTGVITPHQALPCSSPSRRPSPLTASSAEEPICLGPNQDIRRRRFRHPKAPSATGRAPASSTPPQRGPWPRRRGAASYVALPSSVEPVAPLSLEAAPSHSFKKFSNNSQVSRATQHTPDQAADGTPAGLEPRARAAPGRLDPPPRSLAPRPVGGPAPSIPPRARARGPRPIRGPGRGRC